MNCMHCRGQIQRSTAPFHVDRKGVHLVLDAVPASVCRLCGEAYFEESAVDRILDMIRAVEERAEALAAV